MSRPLSSRALLRMIGVTSLIILFSWGIGYGCIHLLGRRLIDAGPRLPIPFWISTLLLFLTSILLQSSLEEVKRERRNRLIHRLRQALIAVTLFLGMQSYGLWGFVQRSRPEEAATGSEPFILVFAALHGAHAIFAVLVMAYVFAQAMENRYDHEYYWGIIVCAMFWHALGWVWLCILMAGLIAL